jgi:hypothetical protein
VVVVVEVVVVVPLLVCKVWLKIVVIARARGRSSPCSLKKTLVSSDSWYLRTGQEYLLGSLVGNFSYFSFEMEVQDGAPCSLKDRLVTTGLGSTSQLLSGIISTGAKFLRISRFSRWALQGSSGLKHTQLLGLKFSTSNWILGS